MMPYYFSYANLIRALEASAAGKTIANVPEATEKSPPKSKTQTALLEAFVL